MQRTSPPTPSAWASAVAATDPEETATFVVRRANGSSRARARDDRSVAMIAVDDGIAIIGGASYARAIEPVSAGPLLRRMPWGRFALMRSLARTSSPRTQSRLATESGITQAAVSLELRRMGDAVERTRAGWFSVDRPALWQRFLGEYPGPRGIVEHWFSVQPVIAQSNAAASVVPNALLSGDSAADILAPWRTPRQAVVYGTAGADLSRLTFAESDATEATLRVVIPADPSITATARAWDPTGRTVDPLIAAWDVLRSGGADAAEAVARLERSVSARSDA